MPPTNAFLQAEPARQTVLPTLFNYTNTIVGDQFQTGTWSRGASGQGPGANLARQRAQDDRYAGGFGSALDRRHYQNEEAGVTRPILKLFAAESGSWLVDS